MGPNQKVISMLYHVLLWFSEIPDVYVQYISICVEKCQGAV